MVIVGILIIVCMIAGIMSKKISLIIAFIGIPAIGAFVLGKSATEIIEFATNGITSMLPNIMMLPFATILFFMMSDAGLFNIVARFFLKILKNKVWMVLLFTAIIAMFCGTGSAVMFTTVSAMLPLLQCMKVRPQAGLLILMLGQMFMCMLPWQNAMVMISALTGHAADEVFRTLLPVMIIGIVLVLAFSFVLAKFEIKHGAGLTDEEFEKMKKEELSKPAQTKVKKGVLIFDGILVIATIVILIGGWVNSALLFMLAVAIALFVNYPNATKQNELLQKVGPVAFNIVITLLSMGFMMGVLGGTGVLAVLAKAVAGIIPAGAMRFIPIILGIVGFPLMFLLGSSTFCSGILPVLAASYATLFSTNMPITAVSVICYTSSLMSTPYSPMGHVIANYTNLDYQNLMKYAFPWILLFTVVSTAIMAVTGIII